jgi:hypothetical protein
MLQARGWEALSLGVIVFADAVAEKLAFACQAGCGKMTIAAWDKKARANLLLPRKRQTSHFPWPVKRHIQYVVEDSKAKEAAEKTIDRAFSPRWQELGILPRAMPWAGMRRAVGALGLADTRRALRRFGCGGESAGREADFSTSLRFGRNDGRGRRQRMTRGESAGREADFSTSLRFGRNDERESAGRNDGREWEVEMTILGRGSGAKRWITGG